MAVLDVSSDTTGWIMCIVSGIACVAGASVICVDLVVCKIPGMKDFRIQESNGFLAASLSLSFGVMIFSALHSMLPESNEYLVKAGWDAMHAGLIYMACFVGGFMGIQVISRVLHQFMPHHVVDCDHSHAHDHDEDLDDPKLSPSASHSASRQHSRVGRPKQRAPSTGRRITTVVKPHHSHGNVNGHAHHHHHNDTEDTPLLGSQTNVRSHGDHGASDGSALRGTSAASDSSDRRLSRRPSLAVMRDRLVSFVKDTPKDTCDGDGNCYGYSDPCGQECFKHISARNSVAVARNSLAGGPGRTRPSYWSAPLFEGGGIPEANNESSSGTRSPLSPVAGPPGKTVQHEHHDHPDSEDHPHAEGHTHTGAAGDHFSDQGSEVDLEAQEFAHHHHVPENAFLSIGFQTVIAIALHKFPEGFITYVSNHANPQLGFNVFMALFVHNITEGFAMALPLYMALGSRVKAIGVATVLGGFTQPLGAAIGWLVIKFFGSSVGSDDGNTVGINHTAYAMLFATTAGIMASVALQLFVESLSLNHNRNLSIVFAFLGMVLLGVSGAVAGHSH